MRALIISGYPAAGKTVVAKILAEKLHIKVVGGGDVLKEMAIERGYHPGGEDWWDTKEGKKFVKERETDPNFDKEADNRLLAKIKAGNVIITSYTMPWLAEEGIKIWLDASEDRRTERMVARDKTDFKETKETIKFREENNAKLYKELYNIHFGKDKKVFDIIVDTNNISAEQVAEEIYKKLKELKAV